MKPAAQYYTSDLSKFCAEHLPGDFHFLDGDEVMFKHSAQPIVYARETGILRILESKRPNEEIRRSQREVLPILARVLADAVEKGLLKDGSGVFIVTGEYPYVAGASVSRVEYGPAISGLSQKGPFPLSADKFADFIRCRLVNEAAA